MQRALPLNYPFQSQNPRLFCLAPVRKNGLCLNTEGQRLSWSKSAKLHEVKQRCSDLQGL